MALRGVSVRRPSGTALDAVDLEVRAGEIVALVGPSGAGKSTLLGVANGTVAPTSGTVTVLGHDRRSLPRAVAARIGTVHQQLHLVPALRVVHNVNAGRLHAWPAWRALWSLVVPQEVDRATAVLDRVGLAHKLHEPVARLSAGEQQRVAVARVLAQDPDLVLADEPISSQDPERAERVMQALVGVAGPGRAALVCLHDARYAKAFCHRIVGLRAGRIAFDRPSGRVDAATLDALYAGEPHDG